MKKLTKLTILSLSALMICSCGGGTSSSASGSTDSGSTPSSEPSSDPSVDPSTEPTPEKTDAEKAEDMINAAVASNASITYEEATMDYGWGGQPSVFTATYGRNANGLQAIVTEQEPEYPMWTYYTYYTDAGELEGYQKFGDELQASNAVSETTFEGVNLGNIILNPSYGTVYGGVNALVQLFGFGKENLNSDFTVTLDGSGFSAEYGYVDANSWGNSYYYVTMYATFGEDGSLATLGSKRYALYEGDYTLDDENGTFTVNDIDSLSALTLTYSQTVGTLSALDMPYTTLDPFYLTSYDIAYNGTIIPEGGTVTAALGTWSIGGFTVENMLPDTANLNFEDFTVTVDEGYGGYYSTYSNEISLSISEAGTYSVSISSKKGVTKNFTVVAAAPDPESFSFLQTKHVTTHTDWGDYDYWTTSDLSDTMYLGKSVNILCEVSPSSAEAGYTLTCDKVSLGDEGSAFYQSSYDDWGDEVTYYCFTPTETGDYTFTATSTAVPSVSSTFTITVKAAPTVDEIYSGTYRYINTRGGYVQYSVSFNGGTAYVCSYSFNGTESVVSTTAIYTYEVDSSTEWAAFTYMSGDKSFDITNCSPDDNYNLTCHTDDETWDYGDVTFYSETNYQAVLDEISGEDW